MFDGVKKIKMFNFNKILIYFVDLYEIKKKDDDKYWCWFFKISNVRYFGM